jgi:hypothetical protein
LCSDIRLVTEFMVNRLVLSIRVLQCLDAIYSVNQSEKWTPERNANIGHTPAGFKQAGVNPNGILECKFLSKNVHRAGWQSTTDRDASTSQDPPAASALA